MLSRKNDVGHNFVITFNDLLKSTALKSDEPFGSPALFHLARAWGKSQIVILTNKRTGEKLDGSANTFS